MNVQQLFQSFAFLLAATLFEVSGDALVRKALFDYAGPTRMAAFVGAAALLFGYGSLLNLAPVPFDRVVGLYIATLFVVWQVTSFVAFRSIPSLPILVGGALVIAGGAIITFWQPPGS